MNEFVLQKLGNNITRFQVGGASKVGIRIRIKDYLSVYAIAFQVTL